MTNDTFPRLRPAARQGKAYYAELKHIYREITEDVKADVDAIHAEGRKITVRDLLLLALKYELNVKAMADLLEELRIVPFGRYDDLRNRGFRPMTELRKLWEAQRQPTAVEVAFEKAGIL